MVDRIIILVSIDVAVKNRTDNTLGKPKVLSVLFFFVTAGGFPTAESFVLVINHQSERRSDSDDAWNNNRCRQ